MTLRRVAFLTWLCTTSALAGPVVEVAGRSLPALTEEPTDDALTYVAPARSELARRLGKKLMTFELDEDARKAHGVERFPEGELALIRVHRVGDRFFLYHPCDWSSRSLTVLTKDRAWLVGAELFVLPISKKDTKGAVTTVTLDTSHAPPFLSPTLVLRATKSAGRYEELDGTVRRDLMTFSAASTLDVVVQRCRANKVPEFDFTPPKK